MPALLAVSEIAASLIADSALAEITVAGYDAPVANANISAIAKSVPKNLNLFLVLFIIFLLLFVSADFSAHCILTYILFFKYKTTYSVRFERELRAKKATNRCSICRILFGKIIYASFCSSLKVSFSAFSRQVSKYFS